MGTGWQGLSLWRKAIYWLIATLFSLFPAVSVALIAAAIPSRLGMPVAVEQVTFGIVFLGVAVWVFRFFAGWMREDVDYVDSDAYADGFGASLPKGSRHWP